MRTIYKQELDIRDIQIITVPFGAKMLYLDKQKDTICVWYECETKNPYEERTIYCFGTGHEIPNIGLRYIGSTMMLNGEVVFHYYEKI